MAPIGVNALEAAVMGAGGGGTEVTRRRPRGLVEPESEPEVLLGMEAEHDCVLAPELKRLRLTEAHGEDAMVVDFVACESTSSSQEALPGNAALGDAPPAAEVFEQPAAPSPAEIWRAEMKRRAAEEMRRYRQEMRNREEGISVRPWC
mmetsp:Transcript_31166/g.70866  ORF Transcript_31166/g.70866 Transcript_31166/m.70866 type:complete len:148 (-) Transcript_31166:122-565(-)